MENKPLIGLTNLAIRGEERQLLSSATLQIVAGEGVGIFGPGGSGKSLLLHFLNGYQVPDLKYNYVDFFTSNPRVFYLNCNHRPTAKPVDMPLDEYDLFLIDEPENCFSPEKFEEYYLTIKETGKTLCFVTHHLRFIELFADRVAVLKYGEFLGAFSNHDFFNHSDPFIAHVSVMGC